MKRCFVAKDSVQPSSLPFRGAPISRMSPWHLPFRAVGSGAGASATCPFLPCLRHICVSTRHSSKPLTSFPFMPNSTSLEIPLLASANGYAASWQGALVPVPSAAALLAMWGQQLMGAAIGCREGQLFPAPPFHGVSSWTCLCYIHFFLFT